MSQPRVYLIDASIYVFRAWHTMPDEFRDTDGWPTNAVQGFARFLLDDPHSCETLKQLRHELARLVTPPNDAFPGNAERRRIAQRIIAEHSFDKRAETLIDDAVRELLARR